MIKLRDAQGIIIGRYEDETDALVAVRDIIDGYERQICTLERDGKTTHVGRVVGEIEKND